MKRFDADRLTYTEMPFTVPVPGREPWTERQKAFERTKPNPCTVCGNDFIEIFGDDTTRWFCGCKPCSKRDGGREHVTGLTREGAVAKWNEINPKAGG